MVAPTSETARPGSTLFQDPPVSRDVPQLPREIYEGASLAPDLHLVIGKKLRAQQISSESWNLYLASIKSKDRYNRAFKLFWSFCLYKGHDPIHLQLNHVAALLLQFDKLVANQARNAYAALLHVPGYDQLRFAPLLKASKKQWNTSVARYATFYDASNLLIKLRATHLPEGSLLHLRIRTIIVWRLLMLARSIDLARIYRSSCLVDGQPFVLIQRKGWSTPRRESVLQLPGFPDICPW